VGLGLRQSLAAGIEVEELALEPPAERGVILDRLPGVDGQVAIRLGPVPEKLRADVAGRATEERLPGPAGTVVREEVVEAFGAYAILPDVGEHAPYSSARVAMRS
jgi:hypothetical protein